MSCSATACTALRAATLPTSSRWSSRRPGPGGGGDVAPERGRRSRRGGGPRRRRGRRWRRPRRHHVGDDPAWRHALEHPLARTGDRPQSHDHQSHLAGLRAASTPERDLQAVARPAADREGPRHRRPLRQPARPCRGAVRRREVPDSSPRPHCALAAHAARPGRTANARLSATRHHVAVCGARRQDRHRHRRDVPPPPGRQVPQVPRPRRRELNEVEPGPVRRFHSPGPAPSPFRAGKGPQRAASREWRPVARGRRGEGSVCAFLALGISPPLASSASTRTLCCSAPPDSPQLTLERT